ncbi:MAG: DUF362 domain-containing protein [Candidatus Edwardsbacteria bacterium]|nr:DUF362 domain-containing protein [Candidatus Edwardsbacteria bacterium]
MTSRVSLVKCSSYDLDEISQAVSKAVDLLGGISSFIKPGNKILLKPNLLQAARPEDMITTHPAVVEDVIVLVKQAGGVPMLGDSPAGAFNSVENYWRTTGMWDVCKKHNVELVQFEKGGVSQKERHGRKYHIAKSVTDADVIINLPKIKTHGLTLLTCAVKNMYGVIPGLKKSNYHKEAPKPWEFSAIVVDVYALAKPHLTIVDGIVGMDGAGPSAGKQKPLGLVLAGADGVAVDAVVTHLMGKRPLSIPTTKLAHNQKLGEAELHKIELLGDRYEVRRDFTWPPNWFYAFVPRKLARVAAKLFWIRPVIDAKKCVNCGFCVESCPVSALSAGVRIPEFNYRLCINCLCCQEVCPHHAVYQRRSRVARMLGR